MITQNLNDFLFINRRLPKELKDSEIKNNLLNHLDKHVTIAHHGHKTLLLHAGMVADRVYFVEKGIVRGYTYNTKNKKEKTVSIWIANSILTDVNSFTFQVEAKINVEVFAGTTLASLSYRDLKEIIAVFPFAKVFFTCLMKNDIKYNNKGLLDKDLNAIDRLQEMRNRYPDLDSGISKGIIASFLNITPQYLSKILKEPS